MHLFRPNVFPPALVVTKKHKLKKQWNYEYRVIEVEQATFTPLVFSSSSEWSPSNTMAFKSMDNPTNQP